MDNLKEFHCHKVWAGGRLAAQEEKLTGTLERMTYPEESRHFIATESVSPEVFTIPCSHSKAKIRAVEIVNETITQEAPIDMVSRHGSLVADPTRDIVKAAVFNKSDAEGASGLGFAKLKAL